MVDLVPIVKMQMAEIDRLRAENSRLDAELQAFVAWAGSDLDAVSYMQRTYSNPNESTANRTKCALGAAPYERAKLIGSNVVDLEDWAAKTRRIRLAAAQLQRAEWAAEAAKVIEHQPLDLEASAPATVLGGPEDAA
jgi:hypothetical protein